MNLIVVAPFLLIVLSCQWSLASADDAEPCQIPSHYKEIGCTPITKPSEKCPSSYNCDHIYAQDPTKCHYRGHVLEVGTELNSSVPTCLYSAHCYNSALIGPQRQCSRSFQVAGQKCINLKTDCCDQFLCHQEHIDKLDTCYMNGEKHYFGQKFTTKQDKCMECLCDEHFANTTTIYKNKNCKPIDCFNDFFHLPAYRKGCAPVFQDQNSCCPTSTKCASEKYDKLIKAETTSDSGLKCKFGDMELALGDRINDIEHCIDCQCVTPPLMTCYTIGSCKTTYV